jgi:hypothetical protein
MGLQSDKVMCRWVPAWYTGQSSDPGVSNLFWELFSTHDPRKWLKKWGMRVLSCCVDRRLLAWLASELFLKLQVSWLTKLGDHKNEGVPGEFQMAAGWTGPCLGQ